MSLVVDAALVVRSRLGMPTVWLVAVVLLIGLGVADPSAAQSPPDQTPAKVDEVIRLLSDPEVQSWLEAKKAAADTTAPAPVATVAQPPADGDSAVSFFLDRVRHHIERMSAAIPTLPAQAQRASSIVMADMEERGPVMIFTLVVGFILVGLGLDWTVRKLMGGYRRWLAAQSHMTPKGRVRGFSGRLLYATITLIAFVLGSAGLFVIFEWPPLIREIVLAYLLAAIIARASLMLGRACLLPSHMNIPHSAARRVLPFSDAGAAHWYRWFAIDITWVAFVGATFNLLSRLGFDLPARQLIAIPISVVDLLLLLATLWLRPSAAGSVEKRGNLAISWGLTAYFIVLWVISLTGARALFWFVAAVLFLPGILWLSHRAVAYTLRDPDSDSNEQPVQPILIAVIDRGLRVALIVAAGIFLSRISGLDMAMMSSTDTLFNRFARGALNALVIILAADFGWSVVRALIAHRLGARPNTSGSPDTAGHGAAENARLRTLLPIIQNIMFAALLVITILMVLSSIGIEIAPLIAGAGVIGVAIGFGAQTLVKDVISGIFYLFDDAFRVGEYIQSSGYKGTVESFSLRSVKLRHHRGYLFTVPFGELGAVQNMSRDWVIDKFSVNVDYKTDIEKARKIIKKIGLDLAADPEYAPHIIEPLKMQGVENFGDYGIELRIKMMTKPGEQFIIRRKAYVAIQRAFEENGIKIPFPTVQVQEGGGISATVAGNIALAAKVAPPA